MQSALHLIIFWALAFVTLAMALFLLSIFFALIEDDLTLLSAGEEAIIAGVASLIEGASVWVVVTFIPLGARALFIPALLVGLIYKVTHLEDWGRYEILLLLLFQLVISAIGAILIFGHFAAALGILVIFAVCLAVTIAFMRGL
jgi:uncharacterized membrane protein YhaH (DUF805 family)